MKLEMNLYILYTYIFYLSILCNVLIKDASRLGKAGHIFICYI